LIGVYAKWCSAISQKAQETNGEITSSSSLTKNAPMVLLMSQATATHEQASQAGQLGVVESLPSTRVRSIQKSWRRVRILLDLCTDTVAGALAVTLGQSFRLKGDPLGEVVAQGSRSMNLTYASVSLAFVLLWVVSLGLSGAYQRRATGLWDHMTVVWRSSIGLLAMVGIVSLFLQLQLSRSYVVVSLVAAATITIFGRAVVRGLFVGLQQLGIGVDRIVLIGSPVEAETLRTQLATTAARKTRVVESIRWQPSSVTAGIRILRRSVERHGATSVIVCGPTAVPPGAVRGLAAQMSEIGVALIVSPGMAEAVGPGVQLHAVGDLFLLRIRDARPGLVDRILKVLLDRVVSLLALVLLSPLLVVLGVLIRRDSPGPALFKQRRIGRNGNPFTIYKFRSMAADAEDRLRRDGLWETYVEHGYKLPNGTDPRVTKLGALLRRTSLDELPQFFNSLNGTMSLVGPRPVLSDELDCYGDLRSVYIGLRPGITGYWQVNGRSDIGFPERAELDAYYFDNRSIRVDLRILSRTIAAVALRVGAH
jgi:exopolysaccharide biosynthesis polyprenyl glycosylphosphotransferase